MYSRGTYTNAEVRCASARLALTAGAGSADLRCPYPGRVTLHLFDTATRSQREFVPLRAGAASIYVCGATVQGIPHIGHVRSSLNYDVLRRWLTYGGLDVTFVRNVTDIEDKILTKAAAARRPWWEWAATHEREFLAAYDALGCLPSSIEPRATGHVTQMVELMERLIGSGNAYAGGRRRLLRRAVLPRLRRAVRPAAHRRRAGGDRGPRQARPPRLHAVEDRQAGRAGVVDAVGPGTAGLAPGVLGDGHVLPRPGVRHPRRRHRPRLPAPRERARPEQRGGRPVRAVLAAQRLGDPGRGEDEQVAGQHAVHRRAAAPGARRRAALLPRGPALPLDDRVLRRGARRGGGRVPADRVVRAPRSRAGRPARGRTGGPRGVRRRAGRRPGHPGRARGRARRRARGQHRAGRGRPHRGGEPGRRPCAP